MAGAEGPIRIVFATDGGYAMPLAAAICSIVANSRSGSALQFHVLCNTFPEPLRARVEASLGAMGQPQASLAWHDASVEALQHLPSIHPGNNKLTYLRLLIADLLPAEIDKVIYLDADLVALDDIAALWSEPVDGRSILAARDRIGTVASPMGLPNYRALGIPPATKYFNGGVMVLNLRRWRERDVSARILRYLSDHADLLRMGDQDGLNAVLFDDWGELDFRWNWQVVPDMGRAVAAGCWGLDLFEKTIVHFVTGAKPWVPGSRYAERHLFFRYLDMTAWRGWRVPAQLEAIAALKRLIRRGMGRLSPGSIKSVRRA